MSIEFIDLDAFHKCTKLKKLNLIDNKLTYISPLVFEKCNKLQILNLQRNPLQSVFQADFLRLMPNLQVLSLQGNNFLSGHGFNVTEFPVMKHLRHLDLRLNDDPGYSISSIDTQMFLDRFPNLKQLDLVDDEDNLESDELNSVQKFFIDHNVRCCQSNINFVGGI